jgi:predicted transcriptional regulator
MWYCVSVLSVAQHDDKHPSDALWEEQMFLVDAQHEEDARVKGEKFARANRAEYRNVAGEMVRWKFEKIESVHEVMDEELKSGTEVFSRFLRQAQVENLLKSPFPE